MCPHMCGQQSAGFLNSTSQVPHELSQRGLKHCGRAVTKPAPRITVLTPGSGRGHRPCWEVTDPLCLGAGATLLHDAPATSTTPSGWPSTHEIQKHGQTMSTTCSAQIVFVLTLQPPHKACSDECHTATYRVNTRRRTLDPLGYWAP